MPGCRSAAAGAPWPAGWGSGPEMVPATLAAAANRAEGRRGRAERGQGPGELGQGRLRTAYLGGWLSTAGEHRGQTLALRRGLQALASLDLSQQLRVVTRWGHHVERLGAYVKAGEEALARGRVVSPAAPTCASAAPAPSQDRLGDPPWPQAAIQIPSLAGGSALGGPRVGTPTGSQKSCCPDILPALLTGGGAPAWGPLGVHDGSWAGPRGSNGCPRSAHSLPSSDTPLGPAPDLCPGCPGSAGQGGASLWPSVCISKAQ